MRAIITNDNGSSIEITLLTDDSDGIVEDDIYNILTIHKNTNTYGICKYIEEKAFPYIINDSDIKAIIYRLHNTSGGK